MESCFFPIHGQICHPCPVCQPRGNLKHRLLFCRPCFHPTRTHNKNKITHSIPCRLEGFTDDTPNCALQLLALLESGNIAPGSGHPRIQN